LGRIRSWPEVISNHGVRHERKRLYCSLKEERGMDWTHAMEGNGMAEGNALDLKPQGSGSE
jgi:hypothetical protein